MYLPSHFEESRPEVLHTLLRDHPLKYSGHRDAERAERDERSRAHLVMIDEAKIGLTDFAAAPLRLMRPSRSARTSGMRPSRLRPRQFFAGSRSKDVPKSFDHNDMTGNLLPCPSLKKRC